MLRSALIAFLLTGLAGAAQAAPKMGVVDLKVVMDSVPTWGKTVDRLKKELEQKQAKLQSEQATLKQKKEDIEKQRVVSGPDAIAKQEADLFAEAQKLASEFMRQQQIITQQELDLRDQMLKRIEPLVYDLAVAGDYSFVFETGTEADPNVLFSAKKVDLTREVVTEYVKKYKDKPFDVKEPELPKVPGLE